MKKLLTLLFFGIVFSCSMLQAQSYTVFSLRGEVKTIKGKSSSDVKLRAELTPETVISVPTAGRIILDLKDKISFTPGSDDTGLPAESAAADTGDAGASAEAVMALMALGYGQSEAAGVVRKIAQPGMTVEEIIKLSLKQLI